MNKVYNTQEDITRGFKELLLVDLNEILNEPQ